MIRSFPNLNQKLLECSGTIEKEQLLELPQQCKVNYTFPLN